MATVQSEKAKPSPNSGKEIRQEEYGQIMFFSFGMFILDEIDHPPPKPPQHNLPGGAGLYALLGARLLSPPPYSHLCSWILDTGRDFPPSITPRLRSWDTGTVFRHDETRLTTRAWNGYGGSDRGVGGRGEGEVVDPEHRAFRYLTPKRRLDVLDLSDRQARGRSWHMVCSAARCGEIVRGLERRREGLWWSDGKGKGEREENRVVLVWEPIPDLCSPGELDGLRRAAAEVDVVSPNAEELAAFFGAESGLAREEMVRRSMGWDESEVKRRSGGGGGGGGGSVGTLRTACIVREGRDGSTVYFPPDLDLDTDTDTDMVSTEQHSNSGSSTVKNTQTQALNHRLRQIHLPAYHDQSSSHLVTDPTGGGNTYLGALALALGYTLPTSTPPSPPSTQKPPIPPPIAQIRHKISTSSPLAQLLPPRQLSLLTSSIAACVAASFAIEQSGVPELSCAGEGEGEEWGGSRVQDRVEKYLEREWEGIMGQIERQIETGNRDWNGEEEVSKRLAG